jgi:hypothetical protein
MGEACSTYGLRGGGVNGVLVRRPEGKIPLGRPSCRWEDNIKTDLQELWYGGMDWIDVPQNRDTWWALVNAVMNLGVPYNAGTFLTG